jgi:hypothetical protein
MQPFSASIDSPSFCSDFAVGMQLQDLGIYNGMLPARRMRCLRQGKYACPDVSLQPA